MSAGVPSLTLSWKQGSSGNKAATMGLKHNKHKQESICLAQLLSQTDKS